MNRRSDLTPRAMPDDIGFVQFDDVSQPYNVTGRIARGDVGPDAVERQAVDVGKRSDGLDARIILAGLAARQRDVAARLRGAGRERGRAIRRRHPDAVEDEIADGRVHRSGDQNVSCRPDIDVAERQPVDGAERALGRAPINVGEDRIGTRMSPASLNEDVGENDVGVSAAIHLEDGDAVATVADDDLGKQRVANADRRTGAEFQRRVVALQNRARHHHILDDPPPRLQHDGVVARFDVGSIDEHIAGVADLNAVRIRTAWIVADRNIGGAHAATAIEADRIAREIAHRQSVDDDIGAFSEFDRRHRARPRRPARAAFQKPFVPECRAAPVDDARAGNDQVADMRREQAGRQRLRISVRPVGGPRREERHVGNEFKPCSRREVKFHIRPQHQTAGQPAAGGENNATAPVLTPVDGGLDRARIGLCVIGAGPITSRIAVERSRPRRKSGDRRDECDQRGEEFHGLSLR